MNASSDRLLRRTLWGNAVFSIVSGAVLALFAGPFARIAAQAPVEMAGLDLAIVFELLGLGVIAFGALCAWIASRQILPIAWVRLIFAPDLARVAGSGPVLSPGPAVCAGGPGLEFAARLGGAAAGLHLPEGAGPPTLESKPNFVGPPPVGAPVIGERAPTPRGGGALVGETRIPAAEGK